MNTEELESAFYFWLEHYTTVGDRHYLDTNPERLKEIYWDFIVDRVFQDLPEMTEEENDEIIEFLSTL